MTEQLPITPPPDLVQQWINEEDGLTAGHIATRAAQYGADQELEACCAELRRMDWNVEADYIVARRRPKPPSLKQQALDLLKTDLEPGQEVASITLPAKSIDTIRQALEHTT
jgi:hypothetical protein